MDFTYHEKMAIIRVLEKMAKADHQFMPSEMNYLIKVSRFLKMSVEDIYKSKHMMLNKAGDIIARMTPSKKFFLKSALVDMAIADGDIDITEFKVLIDTFITTDFLPSTSL